MYIRNGIKIFFRTIFGLTDKEDNIVVIKNINKVKTMNIQEKKWIEKEFEKENR